MNNEPLRCAYCHQPLAPDSRLCEGCGQPVGGQEAAPRAQPLDPPPPPPPRRLPPQVSGPAAGSGRRSGVVIAVVLVGLVAACLLCAAAGAVFFWRRQAGPSPEPTMVRSSEVLVPGATSETQESYGAASDDAGSREAGSTDAKPETAWDGGTPEAATPAPLDVLVGEWEIVEGDAGEAGLRFRLLAEPDGRLRIRTQDEYADTQGIEDLERFYLELEPDGPRRWAGHAVAADGDPETDETTEGSRDPVVVLLSEDGNEMLMGPPQSEGFVARRVAP